jgi:hypothetical protein
MAIALRLIAAPMPGERAWTMDPIDWLTRPGPGGLEERRVHLTEGYGDWVLLISRAELLVWHERDRHVAFEGVFADPAWRERLDPKIVELELLLSSSNCPSLFVAHWFEWESGF